MSGGTSTYDRALRLLAARARATSELRRKMLGSGDDPGEVEEAIDRLVAAGVLDDDAFARQLARTRLVDRGHAPRRVRLELARRGIGRDVADRAIATVTAESAVGADDFGRTAPREAGDAIRRLARRKLHSLRDLDPPTRSRRLYAFLARRGYDRDDIRRAIGDVLSAPEPADSP